MSLYSGISFQADGSPPTSAAGSGSSTLAAAAAQPAANAAAAGGQDAIKKSSDWSSALAFAPVRRPPPSKVKPPRASAALFFTPTPGAASGSQPTDAVRSAEPVLRPRSSGEAALGTTLASSAGQQQQQPTTEQATRALPSLTLDEGAASSSKKRGAPSRPADDDDRGAGGKKSKKKKKRARRGEPGGKQPAFDPTEAYDPTKPNDVEVYLRWRGDLRREKERARKEREARRYESGSESSDGSYYSEDERDELVTSSYKGGFAPPASYNEPGPAPAPAPFVPSGLAQPVPADLTGDEAYARRVALSSGRAPPQAPASAPAAVPAYDRAPPAGPRGYAAPGPPLSAVASSIQERLRLAQARSSSLQGDVSQVQPAPVGDGWDTSASGWSSAPHQAQAAHQPQAHSAPASTPPQLPPVSTGPWAASFSRAPPSAPPSARPVDPMLAAHAPTPSPAAPSPPPAYRPQDPRLAASNSPAPVAPRPSDPRLAPPAPAPSQPAHSPNPPPATLDPTAHAFVPQDAPSAASSAPYPPTAAVSAPATTGLGPGFASSASSAPSAADDFQRKLEERKAAAAAVVARFVAKPPSFGGVVPGTNQTLLESSNSTALAKEPGQEEDTRDFATRLMAKWGHQEGQGLGVNAEGIVNPIEVAQTKQARPAKGSYESGSSGSQSARPPPAMGKIVSETTARTNATDRRRFGEPSPVVTLEHLVGGPDEVDGDLSEEIAAECSIHGIVERVIVHERSPRPPRPEDAVVVFVHFSGVVGAYTAVRALDGRFFGGRQVVARYFPEARFARGDRDV